MIFVTVGTQFGFDRLVKVVDNFASKNCVTVKAQIGKSQYKCKSIESYEFLSPDEMDLIFSQADVIVSHAGMGSIINAIRLKIPIICFPRLACFGEHRNDHQLDTLSSFDGVKGVYCARTEIEMNFYLERYKQLDRPLGLNNVNSSHLASYIKAEYF